MLHLFPPWTPCTVVHCTALPSTILHMTVLSVIHFLKVMYLILNLQVPLNLPCVFPKTDLVFSQRRHPEVCIKQYMP